MSHKDCPPTGLSSHPELEEVLQSTGIAIWEYDLKRRQLKSVVNIEEILGYSFSELVALMSTDAPAIVGETDYAMLRGTLDAYLAGKTSVLSAEFQVVHKSGRPVQIYIQSTKIEKDSQGQPEILRGIVQDVSKKVENVTQQEHFRKMQAIGCLAAGIAHDFNNLLQVIVGYTEIISDQLESAGLSCEDAEVVLAAGDKAMELIKQLLRFSKSGELRLESLPLGAVVKSLVDLIQPIIKEDICVRFEDRSDNVNVHVDPVLLEQLIMNLMVNSSEAMQSGEISVITRTESVAEDLPSMRGIIPAGDYAVITVEDNGPGIDKKLLYRIFEPFYSSKEQGRVTGLGLAIVYAIVERHAGYINVESTPGVGVAFHLYLPVSDQKNLSSWQSEVSLKPEKTNQQIETILIAEDDEMVRRLAARILAEAGYEVIEAESGVEAVEKFTGHQGKISLVILDIVMPELNGRYAYAKMNAIQPGIPVLFSSGYSSDVVHSDHMMRLPGKLLQKPYHKNLFLKTVRNAIDRGNKPETIKR